MRVHENNASFTLLLISKPIALSALFGSFIGRSPIDKAQVDNAIARRAGSPVSEQSRVVIR